jgi:hypothetical protein
MTLLRRLRLLPLASLAGCGLALFAGLAWAFAAPTCGAATMAPFVGCAAPAIAGLWIDWARLYPTTRRAIALSGALLAFALLLGAGAALVLDEPAALAIAPGGLVAVAIAILVGARVLYWLATRARSAWCVISGVVRDEERDRYVLSTMDGELAELDRGALDLGGHRSLDIVVGSPLAVLARVAKDSGAPYRREPRLHVTHVAAAGEDVYAVRRRLFARARNWALYACALALLATAVSAALIPPEGVVCRLPDDASYAR